MPIEFWAEGVGLSERNDVLLGQFQSTSMGAKTVGKLDAEEN